MNAYTKSLKDGLCKVIFTKEDGTERTMVCTLNEDIVPAFEPKEGSKKRKENPNVQAVWDTEKKGWRSFRLDSVKSFRRL